MQDEPTHGDIRAAIKDFILLPISGADILPGGGPLVSDSPAHLRVVDVPNERMYFIPLNTVALNSLIGQATHIVDGEVTDAEDAENQG